MKKLMIAAVAAATVGAASAELCTETGVAAGCAVYNVKINLKTLAAKKKACDAKYLMPITGGVWYRYTTVGNAQLLEPKTAPANWADEAALEAAQPTARKRDLYWLDNATRKWEGVLWQCTSACFDGTGANRIYFVMWEAKAKRAMSYPAFRAWNKDKASYSWLAMSLNVNTGVYSANEDSNFWFLGRYGQKATKVAVGWNPTVYPAYGFHAAGFGSFDGKNRRITSASGNCVGAIAPLIAGREDDCGNGTLIFAQVGKMCEDFRNWCCDGCYYAYDYVPASGTWSLKYNASLSRGTKPLSQIIPAYAVFSTDNYTTANIAAVNAAVAGSAYAAFVGDAQGFFNAAAAANFSETADTDANGIADVDDVAAVVGPVFTF